MKVIVLCGGMGTRLREETEYKPKPMVEIGGKPILWHIMKHYAFHGFKEFVLALGYKGDIIRDYFINYYKYNSNITIDLKNGGEIEFHDREILDDWKITLAETGDDSMTGYRTRLAGEFVDSDIFMLTYGDAVCSVDIGELVAFHRNHGLMATVTGVFPPSRFGDLTVEGDRVTRFKEKLIDYDNGSPINGGYFVFNREFLTMLPDDPTADLEREPMNLLVERGELVVFRHKGFWHSMDTYRDYLHLNKLWRENPPWKIW